MGSRLKLHEILCDVLGNRNVYFQPPESIKLNYPCIVYSLDDIDIKNADDTKYNKTKRYSLTLMHNNPDNEIKDKIIDLPYCSMDRTYVSDNLNHYAYSIYY